LVLLRDKEGCGVFVRFRRAASQGGAM
jgi:hypothetical protein